MNEKKPLFTIKNLLRVVTALILLFVFCPSFMVSCSGQKIGVSAIHAAVGYTYQGERASDPYPVLFFCLILPAVIMVFLFVKLQREYYNVVMILSLAAIDFIIQIVFYTETKKRAQSSMLGFEVTAVYVLDIICHLVLIFFVSLSLILKVSMEMELKDLLQHDSVKNAVGKVASAAGGVVESVSKASSGNTPKQDRIGFCQKCGAPIAFGDMFCTSCGTKVPESLIQEAEEARRKAAEEEAQRRAAEEEAQRKAAEEEARRKAAEEDAHRRAAEEAQSRTVEEATPQNTKGTGIRFCTNCGGTITSDSLFCPMCGKKVQ